MIKKLFIIISLLLFCKIISAADYQVSASDNQLAPALKENITLYLNGLEPTPGQTLSQWQQQIKIKIIQATRALGFYNPKIQIHTTLKQQKYTAAININQGPPVIINRLNFKILGQGNDDQHFIEATQQSALQLGAQLHHGHYESIKTKLSNIALSRGYFNSHWQLAEVLVNAHTNIATVNLTFNSGERYRFGKVILNQQTPARELVLAMRTFEFNEPYESHKLAQYNLALNKSQFFDNIQVFPDSDKIIKNRIPIRVNLAKKPANQLETGGGISSDDGVRSRIKWIKPWLNHYGHSLNTEIKASTTEQSLTSNYKIPIEDPIYNFANVIIGWHKIEDLDTHSEKYSLQLQRHWQLPSLWKRSAFIKVEQEDYQQGQDINKDRLIIPGLSYARTRIRGGLNPHWGDRQLMAMELSHQGWGSDVNLVKSVVISKWIRHYQFKHQFLARLDLGAIVVSDISQVPASMRFFSGGDENLRAYEYNSISPQNTQDQLTGARYKANMSLEYNYPLTENWRLATFIDFGTTTNDFSEPLKPMFRTFIYKPEHITLA